MLHVVAVVPVRGLEAAKARLGEVLDAEERRGLVERLLRRIVAAAGGVASIAAVAVVSGDPATLALAASLGATPLAQAGAGLNEALALGRSWAVDRGADALLVLPGDLPAATPDELRRVLVAVPTRPPFVVLVPDRLGTGTNVLLLAPPDVIAFRFGEGSRRAHAAAAVAAGAVYVEVDGPLSLDLDTPDDLLAAEALGLTATLRAAMP